MFPNDKNGILKINGGSSEEPDFLALQERPVKIQLAHRISEIIREKGLSEKGAAWILRIDQTDLSAILSGRVNEFSLDHLFHFLNALGYDVEIGVKQKPHEKKNAGIAVSAEQESI
jgi:predicted XRE-type DNA-binding protein